LNNKDGGRHSAPATANPSPNLPSNRADNPTGASPAGASTPASGSNNGPANASPHNNASANNAPGAPNGVQRPNTAPVSVSEQGLPSSTLAPDLFNNLNGLDLSSLIGPGMENFDYSTDFDRDFGQWFDAS